MHRKKVICILFVLPPPEFLTLEKIGLEKDAKTSFLTAGMAGTYSDSYVEQEEAAIQAEKKSSYTRAATLMHGALIIRTQLMPGTKAWVCSKQKDVHLKFCQVLYAWTFHFIRDSHTDKAFSLLKLLGNITSMKSEFRFKGKKLWRYRVLILYAWYYARIAKFNASMDYITRSKSTTVSDAGLDTILMRLLEGFTLSNLVKFKEAIQCHREAQEKLAALFRDYTDVDDRKYFSCLAVCLYNIAADYCNMFLPSEAGQYIQSAGHIAAQYLPEGSFAREKIKSLHEELLRTPNTFGFQLPHKGTEGPVSEKIVEVVPEAVYQSGLAVKDKRPLIRAPLVRKQEHVNSYGAVSRLPYCPLIKGPRRSPSTGRGHRQEQVRESSRPISASIAPVSPLASKSVSAKPHPRRRYLKEKISAEYNEVEVLLRRKIEMMQSRSMDKKEEVKEQKIVTRNLFSASAETGRKQEELVLKQKKAVVIRGLKIYLCRRRVAHATQAFAYLKSVFEGKVLTVLRGIRIGMGQCRSLRTHAARTIQRNFQNHIGKKHTDITLSINMIQDLSRKYVFRVFVRSLSKGRIAFNRNLTLTRLWLHLSQSLVLLFNKVMPKEVCKELKTAHDFAHQTSLPSTAVIEEVREHSHNESKVEFEFSSLQQAKLPLFSDLWFESALKPAVTYTQLRTSALSTGFQTWKRLNELAHKQHIELTQRVAATKLQTFFRMRRARISFTSLKTVIIAIQRYMRVRIKRKQVIAAGTIQRFFRAAMSRKREKLREISATCIQRHVRGVLTRQLLYKNVLAVKTIQSAARRHFKFVHRLRI